MILTPVQQAAQRRAGSVKQDLEERLARAKRELPRASTLETRRSIEGQIRTYSLALQDLKRQSAVNPLFVPGDRPGDAAQYAAPVKMPSAVPALPPRTRDNYIRSTTTSLSPEEVTRGPALSPDTIIVPKSKSSITGDDTAIKAASTPGGTSVIVADNETYVSEDAVLPKMGNSDDIVKGLLVLGVGYFVWRHFSKKT